MAYANAHLVRMQKARIQSLTKHSEFSLWCGTVHESANLQRLAIQHICKILNVTAGSIRLVEDTELTEGYSYGFPMPELRDHRVDISPPLQQIFARRRVYPVNDLRNTPGVPKIWVDTHLQQGLCALLMAPMIAETAWWALCPCITRIFTHGRKPKRNRPRR